MKLSDIDLAHPDEPKTKAFLDALNARIAAKRGTAQGQKQGPTPEELAAQKAAEEARARAAAEKQQLDAAQGPLLGTPFDTRNLPQNYQGRYAMAREALLDIGELHNERRLQSNENLHDKMKEAVRKANKLGFSFQSPPESNPFTDDAMQALGVVTGEKGRMRPQYDTSVNVQDPMAAALAAANRQGVQRLDGANPQGVQGGNLGIATGGQSQSGGLAPGK